MKENNLWSGGRLNSVLDEFMTELNQSLSVDQRMAEEDIQGSLVWASAIYEAGVLSAVEHQQITDGLQLIFTEIQTGTFIFQATDEDIHTAVERRLTELIGMVGGKLHTGRSRNDQVVTDFRLWMRKKSAELITNLSELQQTLIQRADTDLDVIISGYTHFQQAQPILLSHWWLSHFWALERDKERLHAFSQAANGCPLGCGALSGTAYPIDRTQISVALGFDFTLPNSLDATSDRDFACDFLYWAAMLGMHLSRCAEALILYSTLEYGYLTLSDNFSTGSSLMPQKKNPDSLELIRGKSGIQTGRLMSLLATMKGLPSAYDKDLQEDKTLVFQAADTANLTMAVMNGVLRTLTVHKERCRSLINTQALATDVADYLVKKGLPFREAHHAVGKAVKFAETHRIDLKEIALADWKTISDLFEVDVYALFSLEYALNQRSAIGGTAPERVREQIRLAQSKIV